jgi:uncharacterized protein (DUF305 family)
MHSKPYLRLAAMAAASFAAMYILMYAMVDRLDNVYPSLNEAYMAGLMAAPMVAIELALMGSMYRNKAWNAVLFVASLVALALLWFAIRSQAAVGDREFLKSMIPHHAGAVLMCTRAPIRDAQIRRLCGEIVRSQNEEIRQMKAILARIDG